VGPSEMLIGTHRNRARRGIGGISHASLYGRHGREQNQRPERFPVLDGTESGTAGCCPAIVPSQTLARSKKNRADE
jgi:hypothetical protein